MEKQTGSINNEFYDQLHDDWYTASDHPVALLRAENAIRTPWIIDELSRRYTHPISLLDIGCGAGFLTNALAQKGHIVSGIDLSEQSLLVAQKRDVTRSVQYQKASAYALPYSDSSFDVACATDVLEHVEEPHRLIAEASRVLKPNGLFFFHTFNRNPLSYLIIIKGVEWCVKNAPKNMHVYPLFIKPVELASLCRAQHLTPLSFIGLRPALTLRFFQMLITRKVPPNFTFRFCKSLATGYCGLAQKTL